VTGGDPVELAGDGVLLDHDERYRLTDEFLTIFRRISAEESVDFKSEHLPGKEVSRQYCKYLFVHGSLNTKTKSQVSN